MVLRGHGFSTRTEARGSDLRTECATRTLQRAPLLMAMLKCSLVKGEKQMSLQKQNKQNQRKTNKTNAKKKKNAAVARY